MDKTFKLNVNNQFDFQITHNESKELDAVPTSKDFYHVLNENIPYRVEVIKEDFYNKTYEIRVNNGVYKVKISDALDTLISEMGFELALSQDIRFIEAPMPGLILEINVRESQEVFKDDPLLILEAMKMENIITSPRDGVIKSISVKTGDAVDKNHLLIEFES